MSVCLASMDLLLPLFKLHFTRNNKKQLDKTAHSGAFHVGTMSTGWDHDEQ